MISSPSESSSDEAEATVAGQDEEPLPAQGSGGDVEMPKMEEDAQGDKLKEKKEEPAPDIGADPNRPWVPKRITEALRKSNSFSEYKSNRLFVFVHMFSGEHDVLGEAITQAAEKEGIKVYIVNLDKLIDKNFDLSKDHPYVDILEDAQSGEYDGGHAGPPCGSFSMARYNEGSGPPPVRSLEQIYGLASNNAQQQAEADRGTILFVRSLQVIGEIIQAQRLRRVPECGTVENPPGSESQREGPAWRLPEAETWLEGFGADTVRFNTCGYQMKQLRRWWKMAQFAGRLEGLGTLKRKCSCPKGFKHQALIGKSRTSEAAQYPAELCREYAKLVMKNFKTTLNLEWWRGQTDVKQKELNDAQKRWIDSKVKNSMRTPIEDKVMGEWRGSKRAFEAGNTMLDHLPSSSERSKREVKEEENSYFVGGMRNPLKAVLRMGALAEAGQDVARLWRAFAKRYPSVLDTAAHYGTDRCHLDETLAAEWKSQLGKLIKAAKPPAIKLKGKFHFESPLDAEMWEAWTKFAKDPDTHVPRWIRTGAPLGMSAEIPSSNGVFPPIDHDEAKAEAAPDLESQLDRKNYKSVYEDEAGAREELQRLVDKNFAVILSKDEVRQKFTEGTVSQMAMLTKVKGPGQVKRRFIIDMLRSGGNLKAKINERIVLPRAVDLIKSIRHLWSKRPLNHEELRDWAVELVGGDLQDAFCHYAVDAAEQAHCLVPGLDNDMVLFKAMLFGFRAAPLIMGRLSACMSRMWQSFLLPHEGNLQCYMDDPLFVLQGTKEERNSKIALLLYTSWAMGINLAYPKGERGTRLVWIGMTIEVDIVSKSILLGVPEKLVQEVQSRMDKWKGMISLRELRSTTGKLSWLAGILPKCKWAVSILYSVVASCEQDIKEGKEKERAQKRADKREKLGLVHASRIELPRTWFLKLFSMEAQWRTRTLPLVAESPTHALITDASPLGLGIILAAVDKQKEELTPLVAVYGLVSPTLAKFIGVPHGAPDGQSTLEAFAVLLGMKYWSAVLKNMPILIKSDSTVALCLARRLRSSSATLNWIGAEMSLTMELNAIPELVCHHLAGKLNVEADYLSRPEKKDEKIPAGLADLKIRQLTEGWMMQSLLEPPGVNQALWGKDPQSLIGFDSLN